MIPKIIHQVYGIYKDEKPIPNEWIKFSKTLRDNHKNWKYKLWDDKSCLNLIKTYYPWFLETYNGYKYPIQKADAIRPFILYHEGGIYLDMDFTCIRNIDKFFKNQGVYLLESAHFGITNAFMASSKNHPFWKIVMEEQIKNKGKKFYQTHHIYIMQSTGPLLITNCVKKYKNDDIYALSKNLFNPCNVCNNKCKNKNAYCYTSNTSSWHKLDSQIINYIFCNYKSITLYFLIIIIISKLIGLF